MKRKSEVNVIKYNELLKLLNRGVLPTLSEQINDYVEHMKEPVNGGIQYDFDNLYYFHLFLRRPDVCKTLVTVFNHLIDTVSGSQAETIEQLINVQSITELTQKGHAASTTCTYLGLIKTHANRFMVKYPKEKKFTDAYHTASNLYNHYKKIKDQQHHNKNITK